MEISQSSGIRCVRVSCVIGVTRDQAERHRLAGTRQHFCLPGSIDAKHARLPRATASFFHCSVIDLPGRAADHTYVKQGMTFLCNSLLVPHSSRESR